MSTKQKRNFLPSRICSAIFKAMVGWLHAAEAEILCVDEEQKNIFSLAVLFCPLERRRRPSRIIFSPSKGKKSFFSSSPSSRCRRTKKLLFLLPVLLPTHNKKALTAISRSLCPSIQPGHTSESCRLKARIKEQ